MQDNAPVGELGAKVCAALAATAASITAASITAVDDAKLEKLRAVSERRGCCY